MRAPSVTAAAAVTVLVCETCRSETGADTHPRDGARLADAVEAAASGSAVAVSRVACLGNCKRRLSAAMVRPGAWSYVFGDLTLASGADLITGALLFAQSTDGLMPWRGRPQSLKGGLIARLPPLERMKATE